MEKLNVFNYTVNSTDDRLDVYIDGVIVDAQTQQILLDWWGDETSVSFRSVRNQVTQSGKKNITFWVNSYGGHVGDAMAIHDWIQDLENQGYTITTKGLGMICSAATYILSAAKNSSISKNSWYMIHNVSGGVYGDVNIIENYAKTMRKFNDTIVGYYSNLTKKQASEVEAWMNNETWFTGTEARDYGFVANLTSEENFKNTITPDHFPYANKAAMNLYNSFVKPANDDNFNLNTDMNKFVQAIVDAFKANNLLPGNEGVKPEPLTEEILTNSLNAAFKSVDISEMVNESINEMFKDGLPEAMQNALTTSMSSVMDERLKNFVTAEDLKVVSDELEDVKTDIVDNAGSAARRKKEDSKPVNADNKFEHEGVDWGTKHLEE